VLSTPAKHPYFATGDLKIFGSFLQAGFHLSLLLPEAITKMKILELV